MGNLSNTRSPIPTVVLTGHPSALPIPWVSHRRLAVPRDVRSSPYVRVKLGSSQFEDISTLVVIFDEAHRSHCFAETQNVADPVSTSTGTGVFSSPINASMVYATPSTLSISIGKAEAEGRSLTEEAWVAEPDSDGATEPEGAPDEEAPESSGPEAEAEGASDPDAEAGLEPVGEAASEGPDGPAPLTLGIWDDTPLGSTASDAVVDASGPEAVGETPGSPAAEEAGRLVPLASTAIATELGKDGVGCSEVLLSAAGDSLVPMAATTELAHDVGCPAAEERGVAG